ncbi:phage tail tape measure protein [Clostridium sp. HBUAS56010]|uniref:phage tail tape measure protein n=1 Tax=Clostridium sp. HBUAS56010 TaxID=2571127 RepID=UPI001177B685|nr:phage tail tape measure protein [Clostridium sp. HBUAS56010]
MADNISLILQTIIDSSKLKSDQLPKLISQVKEQYKLKLGVEIDDKTAKKYANQIFKMQDGLKAIDKITFANQVQAWRRVNSAAEKEFGGTLDELLIKLNAINNKADLTKLQKEFRGVKAEADALGVTGKSLTDTFGASVKKFAEWTVSAGAFMSVIQMFKQMITNVVELDSAMTNLYKVTDETDTKYDSFLRNANKSAQELGRTVSSLVEQTANWAKLGFSIDQSANLAKISSIYANVGEVDDETAVSDMVTAMKAFNIQASDSITIIDKLNNIGNKYAVSSRDLGTGLSNAASALALAGNDIDHSLAMITAMSEIIQDASEAGNALKVLSMRLRGASTELTDAGESTDGMAESTSKLRDKVLALTNVTGKGGFDIMSDEDTFKSTYQIMQGISDVWTDMSNINQAAMLELIAGKQRGNSVSALLTNMAQANNALNDSIDSSGSAMQEQERWLDSIDAKLQQLNSSFQTLSNTTVNSDFLKVLIESGTGLNNILTELISNFGVLPTLLTGVGIASFVKNFA